MKIPGHFSAEINTFGRETGRKDRIVALEADNPVTRSNDRRAGPWGGFWIGTMDKRAEQGAGAIDGLWRGELRQLVPDVTISNAIIIAPGRSCAYSCDTATGQVRRWGLNPDGAVVDAMGNL